jgi:hypothetical protein
MSPEPRIVPDPDRVHGRTIVAVAVAGVVVTLASLGLVAAMLPSARPAPPPRAAPHRIGRVEQTLIERDESARSLRAHQRQSLESVGWIDRDAGTAHIPIGRAIDLFVSQEAAR